MIFRNLIDELSEWIELCVKFLHIFRFGVIEQCHLDVIDDRPNFYLLVNVIENIINPDPQGTVNYVNDPTEDAIYTNVTQPPPRPPKGNRLR